MTTTTRRRSVTYMGARADAYEIRKNTNRLGERVSVTRWIDAATEHNGGHPAGTVVVRHMRGDGRFPDEFEVYGETYFEGSDAEERALAWAESALAGRLYRQTFKYGRELVDGDEISLDHGRTWIVFAEMLFGDAAFYVDHRRGDDAPTVRVPLNRETLVQVRQARPDNTRNKVIRMTETATGAVTYVTNKGHAKARGRAHRYPASTAQKFADEYAATNSGFTFAVEEA